MIILWLSSQEQTSSLPPTVWSLFVPSNERRQGASYYLDFPHLIPCYCAMYSMTWTWLGDSGQGEIWLLVIGHSVQSQKPLSLLNLTTTHGSCLGTRSFFLNENISLNSIIFPSSYSFQVFFTFPRTQLYVFSFFLKSKQSAVMTYLQRKQDVTASPKKVPRHMANSDKNYGLM